MKRYPINSPLLRHDLDLPLFFVNEVPHPYCREYTGPDCSSYSNMGQNTLYYVSGGPFHGYFRYYRSAWAASVNVQGVTVTPPPTLSMCLLTIGLLLMAPAAWRPHRTSSQTWRSMEILAGVHGSPSTLPSHWSKGPTPFYASQSSAPGQKMAVPSFGTIHSSLFWSRPIPKLKNSKHFWMASIPPMPVHMSIRPWG
jgi:hypothetical protein